MSKTLGPGPGAYMLPPTVGYPNHDPSRYRNPNYSIGGKYAGRNKTTIPGPKYDLANLTRVGKATSPAYSLAFKQRPIRPFQSPGPGTYSVEKVPRMKEPRPPQYSMQRRYPGHRGGMSPGPNQYALPSCLGPRIPSIPAAPAYSMMGKHELAKKAGSPGPAIYSDLDPNRIKPRPPAYTMAHRYDLINKNKSPGPANYLPINKECVPHYSFGLRHAAMPLITPEDNMPCVRK